MYVFIQALALLVLYTALGANDAGLVDQGLVALGDSR